MGLDGIAFYGSNKDDPYIMKNIPDSDDEDMQVRAVWIFWVFFGGGGGAPQGYSKRTFNLFFIWYRLMTDKAING